MADYNQKLYELLPPAASAEHLQQNISYRLQYQPHRPSAHSSIELAAHTQTRRWESLQGEDGNFRVGIPRYSGAKRTIG
jgi:hypothetical protein